MYILFKRIEILYTILYNLYNIHEVIQVVVRLQRHHIMYYAYIIYCR
jgi:hypothetical protein